MPISGVIIVFTPLIVSFFAWLRARNREPSTPAKIAWGLAITGASALIMVLAVAFGAPLGERAKAVLERLGYNVHTRIGDGYDGWPEEAPFDRIILTAQVPPS